MGKIARRIRWIYDRQWDYQYVSNILKNKVENVENIFIGSSYVVFGLDKIDSSVVLALPSQDIYYSMALMCKYFETANSINVKRVILGLGYYTLYHDLSRTKSLDENNRILDIYYPILSDLHNMSLESYLNVKKRFGLINKVIKTGVNVLGGWKKKCTYFENKGHSREHKARVTWNNRQVRWHNLSEEERFQAAKIRSDAHAKWFKYENTKMENIQCIKKMHSQCRQKGIDFYIFLAPMSYEYMESLSPWYRDHLPEIRSILEDNSDIFVDYNVGEKIQLITEDFVDSDHMSDSGAEKFTQIIINDFL